MGNYSLARRKGRKKKTKDNTSSSSLIAQFRSSNLTLILILNDVLFDPTYDPPDVVIQSSIVVSKRSPLVVTKIPTTTATMETPTSLPHSLTSIASGMLFQHGLRRGNTSVGFSVAQAMKLCGFPSAGPRFIATRGAPLNGSDMMISHERTVRIDRKKVLLQKKKKWESAKKIADDALAAIAKFKDTNKKDAMDISDCKLLTAKDLILLYQWKYCKNPPAGIKKGELLEAWVKKRQLTH